MIQHVDATGEITEISDIADLLKRSSQTVLYFYPRDNTPGCTVEAQDFTRLQGDFTKLGVQIIGVSKDSDKSHCKFIEKHGLSIDLLADTDLQLHKQYGARGEKNNYGKIVIGVIRSTFILDQKGTIINERKNVRAKGHAERVLSWVKENL